MSSCLIASRIQGFQGQLSLMVRLFHVYHFSKLELGRVSMYFILFCVYIQGVPILNKFKRNQSGTSVVHSTMCVWITGPSTYFRNWPFYCLGPFLEPWDSLLNSQAGDMHPNVD